MQEWIGCRMNMKPFEGITGWLHAMCYPKIYGDELPYFVFELDVRNLKFGPVASRFKNNVYGLFWEVDGQRCKLFFSFENKSIYDAYVGYLMNLLQTLEKYVQGKHTTIIFSVFHSSTPHCVLRHLSFIP